MLLRGLEHDTSTIDPDPVIPMNEPGMKLCISVLTAGRPNYLYICLDSIFRNTVFAQGSENVPDVYVYVDILPNGDNFSQEVSEVVGDFPVKNVFVNDEHKGTSTNYWRIFSEAFEMGYDYCILMEEDWFITTDAIQWLYDVPKIASHYSLYRWVDRIAKVANESPEQHAKICHDGDNYTLFKDGKYLSWCVIFQRDAYEFISKIIKAKAHIGINPCYETHITKAAIQRLEYIEWHVTLIGILRFYNMLSMAPPVSHLAHFGSKTSNYMGWGSGVNRHDQIFKGERAHWLDNLVEAFNSATDEEKILLHYHPLEFKYV